MIANFVSSTLFLLLIQDVGLDACNCFNTRYHHSVASAAFERGLVLRDGVLCKPAKLEWDLSGVEPVARVTLSEGKYHQVKRMLAAIGAHVTALRRESVGTLVLSELGIAEGDARAATPEEAKRFCSMFPATPEVCDISMTEHCLK